MFGRRIKNSIQNNVLYISIDGRSIAVSFYSNNKNIYHDRRIHINGETIKPIEILFEDIIYAFKHEIKNPISKIEVIFESPWVKEASSIIKDTRQKPWEVTKESIDELVSKDNQKNNENNNFVLSSFVVEGVKLNGYVYNDPIGKITEQIEVSTTKFFIDKSILDIIKSLVTKFWDKTEIVFHSGNEYLNTISQKIELKNEMIIKLNSTDTQIMIYSGQIVNERIYIPFGFQNFLKNFDSVLNKSSAESMNWINSFLSKKLSVDEEKNIVDKIRQSITPMLDLYIKVNQTKSIFAIERQIYIIGPERFWNKLFIYLLKEKYFGEIFPHIENVAITEFNDVYSNLEGDNLIDMYISTDKIKK